jgi:hypothetical protein
MTPDKGREAKSKELSAELKKDANLTVQDRNFYTKSEAIAWLVS